MTSAPQNITIYPDYCHTLSPTIGKWCPLRATDLHALGKVGMFSDDGKPVFHYKNHPIKWVRVTGVIVAVDEYQGKNVYTVDDSSGMCIECACVAPTPAPKEIALGVPAHLNQLAAIHQASTSASETKKVTGSGEEGGKTEEGKEKTAPSVQNPIVPWADMDVGAVVKVKGRVGDYWNKIQVEVVKVEVLRSTDLEVKCWNEIMEFKRDVLGKPWVVTKEEEEKCLKAKERELRRMRKGKGNGKSKDEKRKEEREEANRKKKEMDRKEEDIKRRKEREDTLKAKSNVYYPSLAVRRAAAGKYDALGI